MRRVRCAGADAGCREPQRRRRRGDLGAHPRRRAEQTAVLIDGVKLNDPAQPGGGFSTRELLAGRHRPHRGLRARSRCCGAPGHRGRGQPADRAAALGFQRHGGGRGRRARHRYARAGAVTAASVTLSAGRGPTPPPASPLSTTAMRPTASAAPTLVRLDVDLTDALSLDCAPTGVEPHEIDGFARAVRLRRTPSSRGRGDGGYAGLGVRAGAVRHRLGYAFTGVERENTDPDCLFHPSLHRPQPAARIPGVFDNGGWRAVFAPSASSPTSRYSGWSAERGSTAPTFRSRAKSRRCWWLRPGCGATNTTPSAARPPPRPASPGRSARPCCAPTGCAASAPTVPALPTSATRSSAETAEAFDAASRPGRPGAVSATVSGAAPTTRSTSSPASAPRTPAARRVRSASRKPRENRSAGVEAAATSCWSG